MMQNIPHTDKGRVYLWQKRDIFISAFKDAYMITLKHKEDVAKLIHIFDECEFRQILRPTKTYSAIATILSKLEENKEEYAYALLSRAYQKDIDKNRLQKAQRVLQKEIEAVLQNEIPLFYSYGNDISLYCNKEKVLDDHLVLSPVDYALSRLDSLSTSDLQRQLDIIALAIDASTPLDVAKKPILINKGSLCAGELTAQAVTSCAVEGINSVFCGLCSDKNGNIDFVSYNYSLYQGLLGVLCMYAALFRKTQKPIYKELLYKYYEKTRSTFVDSNTQIVLTDNNCSLSDGIVGVLACLEHIYLLTGERCFLQDAKVLANRLVVPKTLSNTDYLNGIGALPLVLNKLECANRKEIFDTLTPIFENTEPFTTGVAHGSSGLSLSLCALNKDTADLRLDEKILSLLNWENNHYSAENNNWYDLRDKAKVGFMSGWCSGAPGIAMARDYLYKHTTNAQIKAVCHSDIEKAQSFLKKQTESKRDTLCCGTSSRLMSASSMSLPLDFTYNKLCCAEESGALKLLHLANTNDKNVSLMQGMSGVAYALSMYLDNMCGGMLI